MKLKTKVIQKGLIGANLVRPRRVKAKYRERVKIIGSLAVRDFATYADEGVGQ